ncbi:hypothetical protein [Sphingobacterium siyangense]|nr:hypothetical protein [Sphingobacterium siyangense]
METHNAILDKKYVKEIDRLKKKLAKLKAEAGDDDATRPAFQQVLKQENLSLPQP